MNAKQLEEIISIAKKKLGVLESKNITILGTSFKPNTDDIRDSIAIELIKKFLKRKVMVTVHDPRAIENTKNVFKNKIKYAKSISDAILGSHIFKIIWFFKRVPIHFVLKYLVITTKVCIKNSSKCVD